jgi:2-dehydropantoate 2-reductase
MTVQKSNIAIIGTGAVGGITAAKLVKAGYNVEVACNSTLLADRIKTDGLHISDIHGTYRVPVPAVARAEEMESPKDMVFLATKANNMLAAGQEILHLLHKDTLVITMQNGMEQFAIADMVGIQRTFFCIVEWGATMLNPGEISMTSKGNFVLGTPGNRHDDRLDILEQILSHVAPVRVSKNIDGDLYAKLLINSCNASLGVISGLYLGDMLSIKKARNIFIEVVREGIAVADAMGIKVEKFGGKIDYYSFLRGNGFFPDIKRHILLRLIGYQRKQVMSSNLMSLKRGRPTEIDFLNGYISRHGKQYRIPTPVNDSIVQLVKEIETGIKQSTPLHFNDDYFWSL